MRGSFCTTKVERLCRFVFGPITQEQDYKSVCELDYCFSELTSTEMILMSVSIHFLISVTAYRPNFTVWSSYRNVFSPHTTWGVCVWSDNKRSHCSVWLKKKKKRNPASHTPSRHNPNNHTSSPPEAYYFGVCSAVISLACRSGFSTERTHSVDFL